MEFSDSMGSKYCVIGRHGLIGQAIAKRLDDVSPVSSVPTSETKVLFHFGSHAHMTFDLNPELEMRVGLSSFTAYLDYCAVNNIQFVYASSAFVYEGDTTFIRFKRSLESLAMSSKASTLGLRIFPIYGPHEQRSAISQWCQAMSHGRSPVVYGNGEQARDFTYIEDAIDRILELTERYRGQSATADVGTGILTSFNDIVRMINGVLGSHLKPVYVEAPAGYSQQGIASHVPLKTIVPMKVRIREILNHSRKLSDRSHVDSFVP